MSVREALRRLIVTVPALGETVRTDPGARDAASDDFGHIVHHRPVAVVSPRSAADVVSVVRFARKEGLKLAPRGAGHTTNGHAQVEGGIVVGLTSLDSVEFLDENHARAGAGAIWRNLLSTTLGAGLTPPVLTDFLGLTVGGTLSVGGLGGTSFRHGAQVDHVEELEIVTGEGTLEVCSPSSSPDLFEAALAGLGQCGIIVRATIELAPAPSTVRSFRLYYEDGASMLRDATLLVGDGRFDYLLGVCAFDAGAWSYSIEAASYSSTREEPEPDDALLLSGLGHLRGQERSERCSYFDWADRVADRVALLESMGVWTYPHPWLDLFVPGSAIAHVLESVLSDAATDDAGSLRVLLNPLCTSRITRPMLRLPSEELVFRCDILRTARDTAAAGRMIASNRRLFEENRRLGGTHYAISAIPLEAADWQQHFGERWSWLREVKRRFDPDCILTPGLGIF